MKIAMKKVFSLFTLIFIYAINCILFGQQINQVTLVVDNAHYKPGAVSAWTGAGAFAKAAAAANAMGTAITAIAVHSGGTSYVVGDIVTVTQGGASGGQAQVLTVSTGVVTALQLVYGHQGTGYAVASNLATTGGSGSGLTVNITSVAPVTGTITLPAGYTDTVNTMSVPVAVVFTPGALITPASGQTVTFTLQGAGLSQICDISLLGECVITGPNGVVYPQWWGAVSDGATSQSAAFNAATASLNALGGGVLTITPATSAWVLRTGTQLYSNITVNIQAGATVKRINSQGGSCSPAQKLGCLSLFWNDASTNPTNVHVTGQGIIDGNLANNSGVAAGAAATGIAAYGWKNSSIEGVTIQNSASDGVIVWCSGPSSTVYNSSNTNCGDNILVAPYLITNSARNNFTNEGGTNITLRTHLSYANGASPQACFDVEPDYPGQYITGFTVDAEWDHCSGPNAAQFNLTQQNEPNAAINIHGYSHDNESSTNSFAFIVPASVNVAVAGITITGNYFGTVPNGIVLDYEGVATLKNVTIAANTTGPVGIGCSLGFGSAVSNVVLAGGVANGSTHDVAGFSASSGSGCVVAGAVSMALAHGDGLSSLTSTQNSILVSGCVNSVAAGCVDITSSDPTVRLNNNGAKSITDKRRVEIRGVSNSDSPLSGLEFNKYTDAGVPTPLGWVFIDGGWLIGTSTPSSDSASPGPGFLVGTNGLGLVGAGGPTWTAAAGAPMGACVNGSLYVNRTGTAGSTLYSCVATGWVAFTSH